MAAIIRCCSSFSRTSGDRPPPREKSRGQETGKLITTIDCSLVRNSGVHHPISKIKHFSTQPRERENKGILQSPFGS